MSVPFNELLVLQQVFASGLDLTGSVQRNTSKGTTDANFTQSENWQPVSGLQSIAMGMHPPSEPAMQDIAQSFADLVVWEVHLPIVNGVLADVRLEDRIIVSGQTLRVIYGVVPESNQLGGFVLAAEVLV